MSGLLAALAVVAPGCASDSSRDGSGGPVAFTPEAPAEAQGPSVVLREQPSLLYLPRAPGRIVFEVVARGAADVHGAAFRVTWDPEALTFVEAQSGAPWSKTVLALAKEGSPGQLAVAWTEKGETGINASGETIMGTLAFDARSRKGTSLAFKSERCQLVDKKGAPVTVSWRGGSIPAR